ncbi:hypothetical protein [Brunnivagina elsteri]|uniref:Uncharacterized protein n=1 Tax=Brunnivagina elsteri CCALA 953 TaxID=987040 RepID=A0A2A2TD30_9CYAN|nr:hypothetical protein [Calothrix elsteri]PAX51623.1 hypothetical protein CK510_23820 [Calothrix elsteri CCALA 953]
MGSILFNNITIICLISFPFVNLPTVNAAEIRQGVKQISQDIATGNSSKQIPEIKLSPGYGVNISFIKTGEIVEKVWLDNPAIASLDVDGCLSGLSQQCEQSGATVIHLRQINKLKLPQLPSTGTSLLTVVTKGNSQRQVYLFQVVMGNKKPDYQTLEILPNFNPILESKIYSNINSTNKLQQISRGLNITKQQGLISEQSRLWQRIEKFFINVRSGKSISIAARDSGISRQLINRLAELGSDSDIQQKFINNSK